MNERYSEEVKSILEAAQQQAVINYNQELTCAHLLVALAGSEGFFPFLLKNAGADAGTFTAEAKRLVQKIPSVKVQAACWVLQLRTQGMAKLTSAIW